MQYLIAGFIIAILLGVVIFLCKKKSCIDADKNERLKELENLSKLIGELAHEIKNPLSTIKVNLKLIAEELSRAESAENGKTGSEKNGQNFVRALRKIAVVEKETDRLEQVLDGFLRYVDRTNPILVNVDINSLISDMVDFYSPQCHSHSITVRQMLYDKPLICKIDKDMLKQAILNLFINSQQAMNNGGELMIRTTEEAENAVITISDTGSGIPMEKLSNIFVPHYSSRPRGSGLGLPTVKRIVNTHNGQIDVDSVPGKGTSFTIKLPLLSE